MAEEDDKAGGESGEGTPAKKKGLLADWKGMKGWQKAGVLIAGGGLIIAILIYIRSQQNPQATGNDAMSGMNMISPGAEAVGYPGYGDIYPSFPVPGSTGAGGTTATTDGSASPPAFTNIASGEAGSGLLGQGVTVYNSDKGVFAMQPGGSYINLNSILPAGTRVFNGNNGRVWYELPGSNIQLLLTSGRGSNVTKDIGISKNAPSNAWKVS